MTLPQADWHSNHLEAWAATGMAASQPVDSGRPSEADRTDALMCSHCGFMSYSEAGLVEHQRVLHTGPLLDPVAGYRCQFCPCSFSHRDRLLCHLEKHTGLGFLRCFVCGKKFSSMNHLVRHVKTTHSRVKRFPCHLCPSKFSRKDTLVAHIRKHQIDIAKH
ncbi:zinc finger protein 660-like isoform X2 [Dermacentor albipictus]|uniref:zinc finger protein 660-like isoform X2 n=1 Tax=Dermacentor albipictus TaxID=60249 RepID=UPI0031FCD7F1